MTFSNLHSNLSRPLVQFKSARDSHESERSQSLPEQPVSSLQLQRANLSPAFPSAVVSVSLEEAVFNNSTSSGSKLDVPFSASNQTQIFQKLNVESSLDFCLSSSDFVGSPLPVAAATSFTPALQPSLHAQLTPSSGSISTLLSSSVPAVVPPPLVPALSRSTSSASLALSSSSSFQCVPLKSTASIATSASYSPSSSSAYSSNFSSLTTVKDELSSHRSTPDSLKSDKIKTKVFE